MKLNMKDMCALLTVIYGTGSFVWKLINAKIYYMKYRGHNIHDFQYIDS